MSYSIGMLNSRSEDEKVVWEGEYENAFGGVGDLRKIYEFIESNYY